MRRRAMPPAAPSAAAGVRSAEAADVGAAGEPESASAVPAAARSQAAVNGDCALSPSAASEEERRVRLTPHAGRSAASETQLRPDRRYDTVRYAVFISVAQPCSFSWQATSQVSLHNPAKGCRLTLEKRNFVTDQGHYRELPPRGWQWGPTTTAAWRLPSGRWPRTAA